jgi:hypothetical protein
LCGVVVEEYNGDSDDGIHCVVISSLDELCVVLPAGIPKP